MVLTEDQEKLLGWDYYSADHSHFYFPQRSLWIVLVLPAGIYHLHLRCINHNILTDGCQLDESPHECHRLQSKAIRAKELISVASNKIVPQMVMIDDKDVIPDEALSQQAI